MLLISRARKLLQLHVFFKLLNLLLSELEMYSKILRKTYQKFIVHVLAYLLFIQWRSQEGG
jgi:hypothetical protein